LDRHAHIELHTVKDVEAYETLDNDGPLVISEIEKIRIRELCEQFRESAVDSVAAGLAILCTIDGADSLDHSINYFAGRAPGKQ
jgi:hypothetical protein